MRSGIICNALSSMTQPNCPYSPILSCRPMATSAHFPDWQKDVAHWDGASEYEPEYRDDYDFVEEILRRDSNVYATVAACLPSPTDQYMVELMLEGVHRTETYALVLGIANLPAEEQARHVKQNKDRIKVRLRRTLDPEEFRAEARAND